MNKLYLSLFLAIILSLNFVSALDIDNIKDVDWEKTNSGYPKITIRNSFLWIIPLDPIVDISLKSHTSKCANGKCNSEQTFDFYKEATPVEDVRFLDRAGDEIKDIPYSLYVYETETYVEQEIDEEKTLTTCEKEIIKKDDVFWQDCKTNYVYKNVTKERQIKVEYNLGEKLSGVKTVGINADIKGYDYVDYVFKTENIWTDELAPWTTANCYIGGNSLWIDGDYCVHTFTTNGTFNITMGLNASILVVAGGGGGGGRGSSGGGGAGGGAGGLNYTSNLVITANTNVIIIGKGGAGSRLSVDESGIDGATSSFAWQINTTGGGGGVYSGSGRSGGSGSGAYGYPNGVNTGGTGTLGQGNNGSKGNSDDLTYTNNGGGGGAGTAGVIADATHGGNGGTGLNFTINGSNYYYAGGGGGSAQAGVGGTGVHGGGKGADSEGGAGENGDDAVNGTGGGGGGAFKENHKGGRGGDGIVVVRYLALELTSSTSTLSAPSNGYNSTDSTQSLSCNFTATAQNLSSVKVNVYDSSNNLDYTNTESLGAGIVSYNKTWTTSSLTDDTYNWACYGYGNLGINSSTANRTFLLDATSPSISIFTPLGNQGIKSLPYNVTLTYVASDSNLQNCSYNSTWSATLNVTTCNSTLIISVPSSGTKRIYVYANDSYGNLHTNYSEWYIPSSITDTTYNQTTYESSYENFYMNVNATDTVSNAYFSYGGTNYTATSSSSGLNYTLSKQITAPLVDSTTNKLFYFGWFQGVDHYSISANNQTVYRTNFALCNGTYNNSVYLNVTFKDEDALTYIRASIPTSTFNYYIDDSTVYRTLTFINNTANDNYAFCYTPSHKTLRTSAYLQYKNDTNFPQRIWNPSPLNLTNTTTNQVLYLLSSTDGLYTTFQVTDTIGNALSGVEVTVTRVVGSTTETVGTGTTDIAGLYTTWVNPDFSHTFTFSKTGYTTFVYTTTPTQSSYDIVMSGTGGEGQVTDYTKGISIMIMPVSAYLYNSTVYTFNYTISSNNWSLDSYGYILRYGNNSIADTKSGTTSTGGYLASNINVGNQSQIVMNYYYVVNSTYVNGTKIWIVEIPNGYSITNFFSRVSTYMDANLLGIKGADGTDNFGKALLSVLILVLLTGGLTYRYGIVNEATILGAMFGVVLFLNTVNFIPNPSFLTGNVQLGDIVVYLVGAITIGMIFKEESR